MIGVLLSYINFHCHSVYSKKDAISEPIDIAKINKEYGNDAFCITDHGDLGGWIQGYQAGEKTGLQFIPGCEFYMLPDKPEFWTKNNKLDDIETEEHTVRYFHFLAFAKNQTGVESLVALYNTHEDHYNKPCITKENLFKYSEGLIVTNACVSGEILFYLRNGYDDLAENSILELKEHFGDDFYIELQYHNLTFMDEVTVYNKLVALAKKHNIKMIATTDSHFNRKGDVIAHNIYKDIYKERYQYDYEKGDFDSAFDGEGYYIKNEEEIRETISNITSLTKEDIDNIINNTADIRAKCEPTHFMKALPLSDKTSELWNLVNKGFDKKRKNTDLEQVSKQRIEFEMKTICDMGFTEYFINMYHILKRADMLGIVTGPARGSAAGSEVCYLLNITKIDPIKNNLMFERFLNPSRFNYPDIDTDIQSRSNRSGMSGKDILIESLSRDLFPFSGQIVNEMRATTIILFKQLARAFGIKYQDVNRVTTDSEVADTYFNEDKYTGWLPEQLSKLNISWDNKWEEFEKYIWFCYQYGGHDHGDKAAGLLWNTSVHASGVILYPSKNKNLLPKNSQGVIYRGHDLEKMGYIKYDLLGLASLDPIGHFIPKIMADKGITKRDEFNWEDNDDKETWDVFKRADTDFVFQFASPGMKRALRLVQPDNITTLAELNALYRPGCIKSGTFEAYVTDSFSDEQKVVGTFLKEEFGENHSLAMIFQEDIMKVCQKMAGFTLGDADLVRRAIQRKEKDTMESYREQFLTNFNREKYGDIAEQVWDAIDACAAYVFNLSHSVAYACIAYWTAYIFCHYQNEFFEYMLKIDQDRQEVLRYLSKTRTIVFPSLETKNIEYIVTDKEVFIPTTAVSDQSIAEYLLSLDTEKKKMIVKYGVLDNFCIDRKGIRELMSEIPTKSIKNLTPIQKMSIDCSTFENFMNSMQALDLFDYEKIGSIYTVNINKTRSVKTIEIRTSANKDILKNNCQEDIRAFGIVRSRYVDQAPELNVDEINERFASFKNDSEDRDMRRTLKKIGEKNHQLAEINNPNKYYNAVMKEAKLTGWPKVKLVFSNDVIEVGVAKYSGVIGNIKAMEKNTPVEVRFNVDLYQKDGEVSYSMKIAEINERQYGTN